MQISLRPISLKNFFAVCRLEIPDEQQQHLATNRSSLLEYCRYRSTHNARAIYRGNEVVGFIMWATDSQTKVCIFRFMIAFEHQKQGVGRTALLQAIEEIKSNDDLQEIEICYSPENTVSKNLYASVGFKETGMDERDEDMLAIINV